MANDTSGQGLAFRQAVLSGQIPSTQYSAVVQDICSNQTDLKPALLDLSARQLFKDLPLSGNDGLKALARDRLLCELRPLYRDEIIAQLVGFIDGVLNFEGNPIARESSNEAKPPNRVSPIQVNTAASASSFYVDSPSRLFLLSFISFGFYSILWTYRHWRHYKKIASIAPSVLDSRTKDGKIVPFFSAIFEGFYIVGSARRIRHRLQELQSTSCATRPWLTFWLFSLTSFANIFSATESFGVNFLLLLISLSALSLGYFQPVRLQRLANEAVKLETGIEPKYQSLRLWDWILVLSGAIFFLLYVIGLLLPPSSFAT
jgi:hypothetical protein